MLTLAFVVGCSPGFDDGDLLSGPDPFRDGGDVLAPPPVDGAHVVINEFQAANRSTWQDPVTWELPDWVELYNSGSVSVHLSDLSLTDASGSTWRGPDDGKLAPGERLFLASSGVDDDQILPFSISDEGGDSLYLAYRGGRMDIAPVGVLGDDLSLARIPDGMDWVATARPTPDFTNGSAPSATLHPEDELFQAYEMHEVVVVVPRDQYDEIDDRIPTECEVTIDGIYFPKADLKSTGEASYDTMDGKPRFVINLDAHDLDREFRGVDNLEMHNGKVIDATRVRDWTMYRYARMAGLPASRVGYAHLVINNDDYGLYVLLENMDDKWIEARFPASKDSGMLFEDGDFGSGLGGFSMESGPTPPNPESVAAMEAADAIVDGEATDNAFEALWTYLEHDNILNYMALEAISSHTDGYRAPHNYRWYTDGVTHKTDLVLSGAEITWTSGPQSTIGNAQLNNFCEDNAGCEREYAEHVLFMADLAETIDIAGDYQAVFDWVRPYIVADPRKFDDMAGVDSSQESSRENMVNNPEEARQDVYDDYPNLQP